MALAGGALTWLVYIGAEVKDKVDSYCLRNPETCAGYSASQVQSVRSAAAGLAVACMCVASHTGLIAGRVLCMCHLDDWVHYTVLHWSSFCVRLL